MPNLLIPIPQTYDAVSRRVAKSVINNLMAITRMDQTTRVEIRGESQSAAQPGSELGDDGLFNRTQHEGRVVVSFRETYVDSEVINAEVRHPYSQPIFADQSIGVHIKPIYSNTEMELTFTYRAKSKDEARIWRDDIKIRMADNRQSHLHQADYHFPVPNFCSKLLMHIYELRENVAGYGDTLGSYLKQHYTDRATVLTGQAGNDRDTLLVVNEKQVGIQGWFDFDLPPEEEKNENGPSYLVSFTYKFSYHKPTELHVVYPQIVHNQLISADYLVRRPQTEDPLQLPTYKSDYHFALDQFDYKARVPARPIGGISIPEYDEWIPRSTPAWTTSMVSWMVVFEPRDLHLVLTEEDVLDTGFLPETLAYMRQAGNRMTRLGHALFHFGLYRGEEHVADGDLEVVVTDQAFEVRTKTPADLRQDYHIRLSFCTHLGLYTRDALNEFYEWGHLALLIAQTVTNELDIEHAFQNNLSPDGKLDIGWIKRWFEYLYSQQKGRDPSGSVNVDNLHKDSWFRDTSGFGYRMDTPRVMFLTIIALSKNKDYSNGYT